MDPDHLHEEDGKYRLKSSFFSDAASVGASCLRRERAAVDEYVKTVKLILEERPALENGDDRKVYGVVLVSAAAIRAYIHSRVAAAPPVPERPEMQAFGIYATGEQDRPNHADVMSSGFGVHTRSKILKAGKKLSEDLRGALQKVQDFKDADLSEWASEKA